MSQAMQALREGMATQPDPASEIQQIVDRAHMAQKVAIDDFNTAIKRAKDSFIASVPLIDNSVKTDVIAEHQHDNEFVRILKRLVDNGVVSFRVNGESVDLIVNDVSA